MRQFANQSKKKPGAAFGLAVPALARSATIACLILVLSASMTMAASETKSVLVLHSYHKGLGWTDSITKGIEAAFSQGPHKVDIFYEFMDAKRIFDDAYLAGLVDFYEHKYQRRHFDAIISSDDHAFHFLLAHHDNLFPGVPVVFCGVNYFNDADIATTPLFTGVVESFGIKETLDGALTIHPETRSVYAVVDKTVTGNANRKLLEAVIPHYARELKFDFITDRDMADVQKLVSGLQDDSIVLLLSYTSDRSGNTFSLETSADLVTQASNRPVYGFWDFYLNHGIVGGMLTTGESHGQKATEIALRILDGEKPVDIAVVKESPNRYIFDYVRMQAFDISPDALPSGSTLINRPPTFYQQYRTLVWQAAAVFLLLTVFTIFLTVELFRRRSAELLLRKSEDKFRALVETTSDWIWEVDQDGRYTYVSPKVETLFGFTPQQVLGKTPFDLMPEEEARRIKPIFDKTSAARSPIKLININRHKNGHSLIIETTGVPFFDAEGKLAGYRGMVRDISDRHRAEKALQDSEARFRDMAELLPETIFEVDLEGNLLYANKSGFRQFQYTPEDLENGLNMTAIIDAADHGRLMENIVTILDGKDSGINEYTAVRRDGTRFPVMTRSAVIVKDGRPAGLRGFLIDISERKRLEEQFQQAQRMESIGTLAGGIAHDFNNLLMGIQGRTQLVQASLTSEDAQGDHLQAILEHIKSASGLTSQLLGFARAGKYDPKAIDLNILVEKTVDMFARTRKELRIHKNLAGDLLPAVVDRSQIEQVFLNLFVNAWHAMPEGGDLTIRTRNLSLSEAQGQLNELTPGEYVSVTVADTGAGMDPQTQRHIFEPFFSTKPRGRGTGLGLASVYGIVRNHNGVIQVNSEPGQGATFTVLLPATEDTPETESTPSETILKGSETILLVDDEDIILDVGAELLKTLGYRVLIAKGGNAALTVMADHGNDIDLVLLDIIMPGLSGKETFFKLKAIAPGVRVLLSSGYSIDSDAAEIMKHGCDGFIQKPFNLTTLSSTIRDILNNAPGC